MTMTHERFAALAEAFGGDVARWPAAERELAAEFLAADADFARQTLAAARALDAALDAWRPLPVTTALREAVNLTTPRGRARTVWADWIWRAGLGAGLAGACGAGVLVGAVAWGAAGAESDVITAVMSGDEAGMIAGET